MTDELDQLHKDQSNLIARAHLLGISLPGDLTADFETAETGRTICSSLEKLVRSKEPLADEGDTVLTGTEPESTGGKKTKPSRAKKASATSQESTVTSNKTKTAKKAKPVAKKAAKKKVAKKSAAAKKGGAKKTRDGTKTQKVLALLKRAGGCTRADILKATGWKAVSVQQIAENLGVKLKVDEAERPFTYKAA